MNDEISAPTALSRDNADLRRRFGGVARLYGERALSAFHRCHVCVIGVGGVGSWAVEALARSGIGKLTLVDLDHVCESNVNRQLHALEPDFGKAKVLAMAQRIADINPQCRVRCVEDFVTPDNVGLLLGIEGLDYIVDCTDQPPAKAAIAVYCRRWRRALISIGGTGGRRDPGRIRVDDLARSIHDPLLSKVRRRLRRHYGFPRSGPMGVRCVYSQEQSIYPQADGSIGTGRPPAIAPALQCGGLGSATHLTASFAFIAVAQVLDELARRAAALGAPGNSRGSQLSEAGR